MSATWGQVELRRTAERLRAEYAHLLAAPRPGDEPTAAGPLHPDALEEARERLLGPRALDGQLSLDVGR